MRLTPPPFAQLFRAKASSCRAENRSKHPASAMRFSPTSLLSRPAISAPITTLVLSALIIAGFPPTTRAGDILRGGATAGNSRKASDARANAGAEAANLAKIKAQDRLARTTLAVKAMQQMQDAARAAATADNVPNGLVTGGLKVLTGPNAKWTGANAPVQSGNNVIIKQTSQQALLNWETFNVGKRTTLTFDQKAGKTDSGKWIAFNRIFDPSGQPSKILGSIKADGQVYVINQNGIVFGGASQVNTRTFVASTLPINDNLIASGLLNNKDAQFLFSALSVPGGSDGTPAFTPPPPLTTSGRTGDIVLERGARISGPVSADGNGGRVMLLGANVRNEGTISTPSGQTILAAGLQVGIRAHSQSDPSLRGLDIWVGDVGTYAGKVTNNGLIESFSGSVTFVGRELNQNAVIDGSTSVNLNGRVDLIASYGAVANPNFDNTSAPGGGGPMFLNQFTGTVNFGPDSVVRILPDYASTKTIPGISLPERSQINVQGNIIRMQSGASIIANNGKATFNAGSWFYRDIDDNRTIFLADGTTVEPEFGSSLAGSSQRFAFTNGHVYFDSGSLLDVSGSTDVFVPLSQNILTVEFRGSELADSPLQRTSPLRGKGLVVDIRRSGTYYGQAWVGTPLGDLTGLLGIIQRNAAQLTAAGGSISIRAGGSVMAKSDATLDVSGGFYRNEGGKVQTSRLLRGGNLVSIDKATPDVSYDGVYDPMAVDTSAKWGVSNKFLAPLAPSGGYNPAAYIEGARGGTLDIIAPTVVGTDGFRGQTITGPRQLNSPPVPSTLSITFKSDKRLGAPGAAFSVIDTSPSPPLITFTNGKAGVAVPAFDIGFSSNSAVPRNLRDSFVIGSSIYDPQEGGFGILSLDNKDGGFVLPSGAGFTTPALGGLIVKAANVTLEDTIISPGGTLSFTAYNFSPFQYAELRATGALNGVPAPAPVAGRGLVSVSSGVTLSVAGMLVDERPTSSVPFDTARSFDGGSITLEGYNVEVPAGSTIDASGGALAKAVKGFSYGKGGSIAILAGKDPVLDTTVGGKLLLEGTLKAYSASTGGKLSLQANLVQIGGSASDPTTLELDPSFFSQGGFTSYSLTGIGKAASAAGEYIPAVRVVSGTVVEPIARTLLKASYRNAGGGFFLYPALLPVESRAPASISLRGIGSDDSFTENVLEARGDVVLERGARIQTDPGGIVSLSGDTVTVLGSIIAPAGQIAITGRSSFRLPKIQADAATYGLPTVFIGSEARLISRGAVVLDPDPFGRKTGTVYGGGFITVTGNIVAQKGAILDVSGSSALLDIDPLLLPGATETASTGSGVNRTPWGQRATSSRIDSNGGVITLDGSQMLYSDATLLGLPGGATAAGGTLAISSGRFYLPGALRTGADINLTVVQSGQALASTNSRPGVGVPVRDQAGSIVQGQGFFAVNTFTAGGFDSLDLGFKYNSSAEVPFGGNVDFQGPVTITARGSLRVAGGGIIRASAPVTLDAPYVAIGQAFRPPLNPSDSFVPFQQNDPNSPIFSPVPTYGAGKVAISAQLIDLGTLVLQNTGTLNLEAIDIRGSGTLSLAGDMTLRAGQIYPTTLGKFDIFAYDYSSGGSVKQGSVTILGDGSRPMPLSAGGSLRIFASNIVQGGTLRAPLGSITLGWDGTDLDPSTTVLDTPFNGVVRSALPPPVTSSVTLQTGSVTSVSAVDPSSGEGIQIPFGLSPDGLTWIDPSGVNVTISGLPQKKVSISGASVLAENGSLIDLRGGGDLIAYRWVSGTGGSKDILGEAESSWSQSGAYAAGDLVSYGGKTWSARVSIDPSSLGFVPVPKPSIYWSEVPESFAVIPGYGFNYAPYGAFNTGPNAGDLGGSLGFASAHLSVGDRVYLDASSGLPAGSYTLLPRRYAILPGAYLVTPQETANVGRYSSQDGASFTTGYSFNPFKPSQQAPRLRAMFEVATPAVVASRASYDVLSASSFMPDAARRFDQKVLQAVPADAGSLVFQGTGNMRLSGGVLAQKSLGGRGANLDFSTTSAITIVGGSATAPSGGVVLEDSILRSWGIGSILVGGTRRSTATGTSVDVRSSSVTLDNPGSELSAGSVTLVSKANLSITAGSGLSTSGASVGSSQKFGIAGDGVAVQVSSEKSAGISRTGVSSSTAPNLTIGAGATIDGASLTLDSTYGTSLDPTAILRADDLSLGSGQIALVLPGYSGLLTGSVVSSQLTIQGTLLAFVQSLRRLELKSYRTLDIYGAGSFGSAALGRLSISSAGIRGYGAAGETTTLQADSLLLSNPSALATLPPPASPSGQLLLNTEILDLGANAFSISGYQTVSASSTAETVFSASGSLQTPSDLTITTPMLTGSRGADYAITAGGSVNLLPGSTTSTKSGELGASLSIEAASINADTTLNLPSGRILLRAKTGELSIGGTLNTSGVAQSFYDVTKYADAGRIELRSDTDDITFKTGSIVSVAGTPQGGNAGTLEVRSPLGKFTNNGLIKGSASTGFRGGSFLMDTGSIISFANINAPLETGGFTEMRNIRVRTGDLVVDGVATARSFSLSADQGSLTVSGTGAIRASGPTGGTISLFARDNLTVQSGASLSVRGDDFSSAGKGGEIRLETGSSQNGLVNSSALLDLQSGATLDLSVASFVAGAYTTPGSSAFYGQFQGKLSLRAPRAGTDVRVDSIESSILGASSVTVEAYRLYDRTGVGTLDTTLRGTINSDAVAFMNAGESAMRAKLLNGNPSPSDLDSVLVITPGVEIINRNGDLTLGTPSTINTADWDLSSFRYGGKAAPGVLTLRASGDLVFNNALSDGFTPVAATAANGHSTLWLATLMNLNPNLPLNTQSWSYRLTAGADLGAADFHAVQSLEQAGAKGSLLLGRFYSAVPNISTSGSSAAIGADGLTANSIRVSTSNTNTGTRYQVIRTGTGDISISAARDVQLRNQFSTIYTAGVRIPVPTRIFTDGDFVTPIVSVNPNFHPPQGSLGTVQQRYIAQWAFAGGDIGISAGQNIGRYTQDSGGNLIVDTSRQVPGNWLYRRGYLDPGTGAAGAIVITDPVEIRDTAASTTWWIDYSNFFQGIGALGGGDISLVAKNDIVNADAVIPTNARMAGTDGTQNIAPDLNKLLEHGGGDLVVQAGRNIDGGLFYVERGTGLLTAGGAVKTNSAKSPSYGILSPSKLPSSSDSIIQSRTPEVFDPSTWLPTTLFLGKGHIQVTAQSDALLGPIVNAFLMPQGLNNKFWYKTYFSTYASDSSVEITSVGGSVTHRQAVTLPNETTSNPSLIAWLSKENSFQVSGGDSTSSYWQPWIRLAETGASVFSVASTVLPPVLKSYSLSGDINIIGKLNLFPSATGTVEFVAAKGVIGLQKTGLTRTSTLGDLVAYSSASVNLSDASPATVYGVTTPLGYFGVAASTASLNETSPSVLVGFDSVFNETGSYSAEAASIDLIRARHSTSLLHAGDTEPLRVYAKSGDVTGFTLYSSKFAQISAGNDITDVAFYIQNNGAKNVSIVSAGRDIVPSNANAPLRSAASNAALGNILVDPTRTTVLGRQTSIMAGDIQFSGEGVGEVLAGRTVDLGTGENFVDGTGTGITSIGNARNPFLPFSGARLIVLAGVQGSGGGAAMGLADSQLTLDNSTGASSPESREEKAIEALDEFFQVLKQTGADYASSGSYEAGFEAIQSIFGGSSASGQIFTRARDIRTTNGGDITLAAAGGALTLASDIFGNPLTPPGIVTEYGGNVSIFTRGSVAIGRARIFTLRGGDITIWSSTGDIAAGTSPKTVVTAPPTRVLIDSTSADVATDLGGLATGGGIGVLASVQGVPPGDVSLIAPEGTVDAGDAGIQATGNLAIAAAAVLNADNISAGGTTIGVPTAPTVAAPNVSGLTSGSSSTAATSNAAQSVANQASQGKQEVLESPSIITVEVIGYGGGEDDDAG